jgi:hypothetical protein
MDQLSLLGTTCGSRVYTWYMWRREAFVECNIQYAYVYPTLPQLNLFLLKKHHFQMEGTDSIQVNNERDFLLFYFCFLCYVSLSKLPGVFLWRNAPEHRSGSSYSREFKPEWHSRTFPGIGIINTPTSQTKFWVTLEPTFFSFFEK